MSRDIWSTQLRLARDDSSVVRTLLAADLPDDVLQHAGQSVLGCSSPTNLIDTTATLIESLSQRDWLGDAELIAELE